MGLVRKKKEAVSPLKAYEPPPNPSFFVECQDDGTVTVSALWEPGGDVVTTVRLVSTMAIMLSDGSLAGQVKQAVLEAGRDMGDEQVALATVRVVESYVPRQDKPMVSPTEVFGASQFMRRE